MTKSKRFVMKDPNDCGYPITDTDTGKVYSCASNIWMKELCTDINKIVAENEQLKQFKENVIKWVDSQMKFNVKNYIETEDYHFKSENIDLHNFKVFIGIDSDE